MPSYGVTFKVFSNHYNIDVELLIKVSSIKIQDKGKSCERYPGYFFLTDYLVIVCEKNIERWL